jgi:hypothetical protein
MLDHLLSEVEQRYSQQDPGEQGRNEARQLAWRLWQTKAAYLWFIGPGERRAYRVRHAPLQFERLPSLPRAEDIGLVDIPSTSLGVPILRAPSVDASPNNAVQQPGTRVARSGC